NVRPNPCVTFITVRSEISASSAIHAVRTSTTKNTRVTSAASGRDSFMQRGKAARFYLQTAYNPRRIDASSGFRRRPILDRSGLRVPVHPFDPERPPDADPLGGDNLSVHLAALLLEA